MIPFGNDSLYARTKSVIRDRTGGYTAQDQFDLTIKGKKDPMQKAYGTPRRFNKGKDKTPLKIPI